MDNTLSHRCSWLSSWPYGITCFWLLGQVLYETQRRGHSRSYATGVVTKASACVFWGTWTLILVHRERPHSLKHRHLQFLALVFKASQFCFRFYHGFSLEFYPVGVVGQPIQDRIGQGCITYAVMPFRHRQLAGVDGWVWLCPSSMISSRLSRWLWLRDSRPQSQVSAGVRSQLHITPRRLNTRNPLFEILLIGRFYFIGI